MKYCFALLAVSFYLSESAVFAASASSKSKSASDAPKKESEEADEMLEAPVSDGSSSVYKKDRDALLKRLKKEVSSNLPKKDVQRLEQSVMRLGSYRADWARKAQDFLVANSAVAELFLYQYSLAGNPTLNARILTTLLQFGSLKFPGAALYFAEPLARSPEAVYQVLELLSRAVKQDMNLAPEVLSFLENSWGSQISMPDRPRVGVSVCRSMASGSASLSADKVGSVRQILSQWTQAGPGFWERVMSEELRSCLASAS